MLDREKQDSPRSLAESASRLHGQTHVGPGTLERSQTGGDQRERDRAPKAIGSGVRGRTDSPRQTKLILFLDGEGYTTKRGSHRYTYLAASNDDGSIFFDVENKKGLTTKEIFEFLLKLPREALKVGFALGYDWTKWFQDLPNEDVYYIYRPDLRTGKNGPKARRIPHGGQLYGVNLVSTKLSVMSGWNRDKKKYSRTCHVWDLFKFFQRSFVNSLREWKVGSEKEVNAISRMKEKRGSFRGISAKEKAYCQSECRLGAKLTKRLIDSCIEAGLTLREYFGAGSLGAATLRGGPAKEQKQHVLGRMRRAVACAFFGGRFEQSVTGLIPISHGFDLASAYPYAETQLPCLAHGKWVHVRGSHTKVEKAVRKARAACCHYRLKKRSDVRSEGLFERLPPESLPAIPDAITEHARVSKVPWGPFPFRLADGSIIFPSESAGGWVWHFEMLAALDNRRVWPNVELREAWVFRSRCTCAHPFHDEVTGFYRKRLQWGKEGKGLVLKKGLASRYGKRAQTVGSAPFHCAIAAGLITSHTRSELLRAIALSPNSVLSVATDGIITRDVLELRTPVFTDTDPKPLGAWEHKNKDTGPESVFLMRPGMRFLCEKRGKKWIAKDSEEGTTAARGVGVRRLHAERQIILDQWMKKPGAPTKVPRGTIFNGGKLCVGKTKDGIRRLSRYGNWTKADPFQVSYLPLPKRPVMRSGHLLTWALTKHEGESKPYDRMVVRMNKDIRDLERAQDEAECQPDIEDQVSL